ncbi:MAG: endonuclease/exonuclease/phosphatase family protein [Boseongicola sp.]
MSNSKFPTTGSWRGYRDFLFIRRAAAAAILGSLLLLGCSAGTLSPQVPAKPNELRLATYNIHYLDLSLGGRLEWGPLNWENRRDALNSVIKSLDADLIAFQEMETYEGADPSQRNDQKDWILDRNQEYAVAAFGTPPNFPNTQPIFYRRAKFRLIDEGFDFFSPGNGQISSISRFAGYPDAVTWARFVDRSSGRRFRVFNIHLHFLNARQRQRSASQVAGMVDAVRQSGDALFVLGDLNAGPNSQTGEILKSGGLEIVESRGSTFHLNVGLNITSPIDHLLHSQNASPVGPARIVRDRPGRIWPSDHYPVVADFILN